MTQEFSLEQNDKSQWQWLFAGPNPDEKKDEQNSIGHGSCMLSKVVGKKYGVAKLATPVIVKVPFGSNPAAYLDGVLKAYDDQRAKHDTDQAARAILSMSWVYPRVSQEWISTTARVLQEFVKRGGNPISGSGNDGGPNGGNVCLNCLSSTCYA